jgi:signal transduction histidine kinase/ActR/RegA family two-component response regulator
MSGEKSVSSALSNEHMNRALEAAGVGLWRWSGGEQEFIFDAGALWLLEWVEDESTKVTWAKFIDRVHADDRDRVTRQFTAPEHGAFRDLECRWLLSNGETRNLSFGGVVGMDEEGSVGLGYGSCVDLSDRKRVRQQPILAQKMEAVGQLTAGISHNFNNILSSILPNLQLAARHVSEDGEKFLRNAHVATVKAAELVAELMVVAGRRESISEGPLDLDIVAERVVRICKTTFGSWIQLEFETDDDSHVVIGNEGHIEQVLLNILINARDALETVAISGPRIVVDLESREATEGRPAEVVLRITDNGPGMEQPVLSRIFEPFYTNKGTGTGLGLATAYAIVHDHGGTISCTSRPRQGAAFEIVFPAHDGVAVMDTKEAAPSFVGGTETILVVDDDHLVRKVVSAALQDAGYEVVQAVGGNEAIEAQVRNENFDLVVLDLSMPELTGDQVLSVMRGRNPKIKVLVFTGVGNPNVEALDVALLHKPAGINDLLHAVRQAIDTDLGANSN